MHHPRAKVCLPQQPRGGSWAVAVVSSPHKHLIIVINRMTITMVKSYQITLRESQQSSSNQLHEKRKGTDASCCFSMTKQVVD